MKLHQRGFTLIEIAIVLVIIGLLLGGVLKGQELINSAKVKNLAGDFKNIPVFIYGYQDKYKALPGDDKDIVTHLTGNVAPVPCTGAPTIVATKCDVGNGVIDGDWNAPDATSESYVFWQHVRLAGFGPGSTAPGGADYIPKNAVGGNIGITNAVGNIPIVGIKGTYIVCSNAIPGKFAKQIDLTLDDGLPNSGSVFVGVAGSTGGNPIPTTALVNDDTPFLVCMGY
ncbi:MAG: prepilin-type N-terminal cleavage/methylation domain-containing protein [Gallionella sp.]